MIPVNTGYSPSGQTRPADDLDVVAEPVDVSTVQCDCLGDGLDPGLTQRVRSGTEQLRREVGDDLVDAARLDERAGQRSGRPRAARAARPRSNSALSAKRGTAVSSTSVSALESSTCADCGMRWRRSSTTRSGWCVGEFAVGVARGQVRVVGEHRAAADDDGVDDARSSCASARDDGEEIHCEREGPRRRPGRRSVAAYFQVT